MSNGQNIVNNFINQVEGNLHAAVDVLVKQVVNLLFDVVVNGLVVSPVNLAVVGDDIGNAFCNFRRLVRGNFLFQFVVEQGAYNAVKRLGVNIAFNPVGILHAGFPGGEVRQNIAHPLKILLVANNEVAERVQNFFDAFGEAVVKSGILLAPLMNVPVEVMDDGVGFGACGSKSAKLFDECIVIKNVDRKRDAFQTRN